MTLRIILVVFSNVLQCIFLTYWGEGTVLIRGLFTPDISHLLQDDSYCIGRLLASSSPLY